MVFLSHYFSLNLEIKESESSLSLEKVSTIYSITEILSELSWSPSSSVVLLEIIEFLSFYHHDEFTIISIAAIKVHDMDYFLFEFLFL